MFNATNLAAGGYTGTGGPSYGYNAGGSVIDWRVNLGLQAFGTNYGPYPTNYAAGRPIRESQVVSPSDMIALGDAILLPDEMRAKDNGVRARGVMPVWGWWNLDAFVDQRFYDAVMKNSPRGDAAARAMNQRHGGRWNIAFCDGHIESPRPSQIFNTQDQEQMRRWNNDHQFHTEQWLPLPQ